MFHEKKSVYIMFFHFRHTRWKTKKINVCLLKLRLEKVYFKLVVIFVEKYAVASVWKVQHLWIFKKTKFFNAVIAAEHVLDFLSKTCS